MSRLGATSKLLIFLAVITVVRLWFIQAIPLASDEANSWQWARHLDWGYFDQGPLIAWTIRLSTALLGQTELAVRLPALLLGLGLSLLLYDFARRLFDNPRLGLWLVVAANSTLLFTGGSIIHTYDSEQAFLWLLSLELIALAVIKNRASAWYWAGITAGLAMLAKYTSVLLPVMTVAALIFTPGLRPWLKRKEPYLSALIAALVYSPNLYWNYTHHWTAFAHSLGLGGGETIFTLHEFIGVQAVFLGPIIFVLALIGLYLAWKNARRGDSLSALLVWVSAPILILFALLSLKSRIYGNWPAPAWIGALPVAGYALWPRLSRPGAWRKWGLAGLAVGYAIILGVVLHAPLIKTVGLDPQNDPTMEIYGWPEMGREIGRVIDDWPGPDKPFIFALRYQLASLAAFYTPGQPRTEGLFVPGERLNAYLFWTDPRRLKGQNGLAVINLRNYTRPLHLLRPMFDRVELIKKLDLIGPAGTIINQVGLYACYNFHGQDARPEKFVAWFDQHRPQSP